MTAVESSIIKEKLAPEWDKLPQIVRGFAERAPDYDRSGSFAYENYEVLHRHGFLALPIGREHGGFGGGLRDHIHLLDQVAQADASTALVVSMYFNLHGAQARSKSWPTSLYTKVARESLERLSLINSLNYEPELGSPVRGSGVLNTVARRVPGGWRVSGHKRYATGSVGLRWFTVAASNEENIRGSYFITADSPGISIIENWDYVGLRGTASHDLILDNVFVPEDCLVGQFDNRKSGGDAVVVKGLSIVTWNAIYLGIAKAARNFLVTYLQERSPGSLGYPLSKLEHVRDKVGQIETLIRVAERLNLSIVDDFENGAERELDVDAGISKVIVRNHAKKAVELAAGTMGNAGLSREYPLERYFRDVQFGPNHPPGSDVVRKLAADASFLNAGSSLSEFSIHPALRAESA
ncbi:acyl-CoA dehydrogenase family protein [Methylocystis parvus]|uniref:Acyl-CoA dehydrogenase n=1 Tax=Methylocystis parvus TaxID=134 RepID=A0A6B8M5G0_9HYPH|nr:acyl-CoA dehydrogenase family protein [Methylocystis parvus]QGM97575.1 acyl-CoA dehydrogenase [Methylocystis parvus]WBJ98493.1 acyl-CoA/acyl-ACP dehydrogenase [Methylocystis parvus OBBP]